MQTKILVLVLLEKGCHDASRSVDIYMRACEEKKYTPRRVDIIFCVLSMVFYKTMILYLFLTTWSCLNGLSWQAVTQSFGKFVSLFAGLRLSSSAMRELN